MAAPSYGYVCALLCEHREEMRLLYSFLEECDLGEEAANYIIDETGNSGFFLGHCPDLDPPGGEAPETLAWKARACEQERFVLAVQGLAQQQRLEAEAALCLSRARADLERARMALEDRR